MYCPKCAAEIPDSGRFCRKCGTDVSLVPQALDKSLPEASPPQKRSNPYRGVRSIFLGTGFLIVAAMIFLSLGMKSPWFWFLIPAFSLLGRGVAAMLNSRYEHRAALLAKPVTEPAIGPARHPRELSPGAIHGAQPPSVVEDTTKSLRAPTGHEN